jgi:hypothetical protein
MEEKNDIQKYMQCAEKVAEELRKARSIDHYIEKEGIFSWLFSKKLGQILEAELSDQLGYERYESKG